MHPGPQSSRPRHLFLLTILMLLPLHELRCIAHPQGMYASKAAAEKRAAELQCKGTFPMGKMWMPCSNERALHEALQKQQ